MPSPEALALFDIQTFTVSPGAETLPELLRFRHISPTRSQTTPAKVFRA
jgi:hypothetical protein